MLFERERESLFMEEERERKRYIRETARYPTKRSKVINANSELLLARRHGRRGGRRGERVCVRESKDSKGES
jgi:hypothetical protein